MHCELEKRGPKTVREGEMAGGPIVTVRAENPLDPDPISREWRRYFWWIVGRLRAGSWTLGSCDRLIIRD
jgi:hypothetical protein